MADHVNDNGNEMDENMSEEQFNEARPVSQLYEDWFLDYASYVILERAVPAIEDRDISSRLSIGYFTRPNYDTPISCIETCASAAYPTKYETTTVKEYNDERFSRGAGRH